MTIVTFKDLPDTTTPINAANLNNNFSELKSSVITAYPLSNYTITTTGSYETIPLNEPMKIGSDFEITGNGIKCLKSGTVAISGKVSFASNSNGLKWLTMFRDSSASNVNPVYAAGKTTICCPPHLVGVSAGQIIYMKIQGDAGDVVRSSKAYTNITIEYKTK